MLPILLGAAGVSYQLMQLQETTYTAATSYGLVQPQLASGTSVTGQQNPFGPEGSALVGAALEAQLNSRQTQQELGSPATRGWGPGEAENDSAYAVKIPQFETTYEVRAWGGDKEAVRAVVDRVIEAAPRIANDLQTRAGAPPGVRYEPFVLAPTQVDVLPPTSGVKLVIAVMGVGMLVGAAWSIVADRLLRRPKAMARQAAASIGAAAPPEPPGSPQAAKGAKSARTSKTGRPARAQHVPDATPEEDVRTARAERRPTASMRTPANPSLIRR